MAQNTNIGSSTYPTRSRFTNWYNAHRSRINVVLRHTFLAIGAVLFMFPLYWLISTSLKVDVDIFKVPPKWIPNPIAWENYTRMWRYFPFFRFLKNTVFVTAMNLIGVLVSAPMVAYSFSRLRWPGRNFCFMLVLATMMLPGQVTMIPLYVLYSKLGFVDTFYPLWVGSFFGGGAFNIFLVRQFFLTIPQSLEESARIDGANYFQIYTKIMLPLIKPVLTTISISTFLGSWNDFMGPLIYINNQSKYTLSLGLRLFQAQTSGATTEYGMLMAATCVMVLPVIFFFFIGQKQFIEGVALTGIKG